MNYEFWFWIVIAFIAGRGSVKPIIYFGSDEEKYKDALFGIFWK